LQTRIDRKTLFSGFVIKLILIMFLVEFVKGALLITFLPIYLDNELGVKALVIGWTLAAQYLGDNLLRTPIGWVIDQIGYRASMLGGVVVTLGAITLVATTSSYLWIIIGCALLGIGTAPLWPCVITATTEIAGEKSRGMIMGVVYMAWLSGVGLGPFVITFFLGHQHHYPSAFRFLIFSMILVVVLAFILPSRMQQLKMRTPMNLLKKGLAPSNGILRIEKRWRKIANYFIAVRRSLTMSPLMFPAMFAQTFALGLLTPILTLYFLLVLGLSGNQFRFFLLAGGLFTVLFMIPVGKLVDRWGSKWFLNSGFLLSSLMLSVFSFTRSIPWLYLIVALLGIGYALIIPAWNSLIASAIPPERRGAVWGFFLTIEGMGTTIGPIVSGKMWDDLGPHAPFITSGCVLFGLLLIHLYISRNI